ncbi:ACP S-malonyltransferase [Kroppenstedtia eburnea]|uniref:[acyl-carrier-protein] S-malonyltransferase n=1 Tax=Kroppenstedtia eburnea TaxID=714067 RepID=A0A1N7PX38_9BACL|nr:ACP S-malonyltransferase [Kroppenstedtia eburnea]QKI80914.1 ACP S-malonyltransferase [Kroppenstedtia eburnea]SIT14967.1 [acyl-carrier-protein] S-malonyltransferase [Kroppenstedtia eburnea]
MTKTAVLFPPFLVNIQPGAYRDLYDRYSCIREKFEEASDALGVDLRKTFFSDDEKKVNHGPSARSSIITISTAIFEMVKDRFPQGDYYLGLSLGQLCAAHASECYSFADMIRMVYKMAFMEYKAFHGSNYGVYFYYNTDSRWLLQTMEKLMDEGHYLKPCAFMADSQMLVTGDIEGLEKLNQKVSDHGGLGIINPNGFPAHCPLMQDVKEDFKRSVIDPLTIEAPRVPLVCNYTAEILTTSEEVRTGLIEQYTSPVLWRQSMERLHKEGVQNVVIIGPGNMIFKSMAYLPYSFNILTYLNLEELERSQAG